MRIQILTPEYDCIGGGIVTFYRAIAPALRDAGAEIRVIVGSAVCTSEDRAERVQDGVYVETLEHARLARWEERLSAFCATPGLRRHLAAAWAMWEQADYGADADIVEACDWGLLFIPPTVEAARPLIVQCHGSIGQIAVHDPIAGEETQGFLVRLLERAALGANGMVQTLSHANAAFWHSETGRDVARIRPAWAPRTGPIAPEAPNGRGLVVGRLQRWKGPHVLCTALKRLGPCAPTVDWVGRDTAWAERDSSTAAYLERSFPEVWGTKLVHRSPEPSAQVAVLQSHALFNLVPSTWDVFNFTVVEAMASGRPAIVSSGAGASELIEDGVNGFLFAASDPDGLAEVLEYVLGESPARLTEVGRAGQETVRTALDPKTIAAERLVSYGAAIDDFAGCPPAPIGGWLGDICRPRKAPGTDGMAFLEHQPLRALAGHVVGRISRRVLPR